MSDDANKVYEAMTGQCSRCDHPVAAHHVEAQLPIFGGKRWTCTRNECLCDRTGAYRSAPGVTIAWD